MKLIRLRGAEYTEFMKGDEAAQHATRKKYWDLHGPTRFQTPHGRYIGRGGMVRDDPGEAPPALETSPEPSFEAHEPRADEVSPEIMAVQSKALMRMKNSGHLTGVPSPKSCKCFHWPWPENVERALDDRGKPMGHHPKCAYRKKWEMQKGHKVTHVAAGPSLEPSIHRAGKVTNTSVNRPRLMGNSPRAEKLKTETVPTPDRCSKCKDFTKARYMEKDQHHPTCVYFKKYKAITLARASIGKPSPAVEQLKSRVMLFDLDKQSVVRRAEPEEVEEGRRRLRDEGTAFVTLDGEQFLCMYEDGSTLEPAEGAPETPPTSDHDPSDTLPPSALEHEELETVESP